MQEVYMKTGNAVVLFEDVEVRREEIDGEQWIPAIDVAKALGYDNPSRTVSDTMSRNGDRFEGYSEIRFLRMSINGQERRRQTLFLNLEGVVMFCMISTMPKAIPFQRWAVGVLKEKLLEIPSDVRLVAKQKRVRFTDTLNERGVKGSKQYSNITIDMKEALEIDKYKPKSSCDLIEVMKIAVAEDLARIKMMQANSQGYIDCHDKSVSASKAIAKETTVSLTND